MLNIFRTYLIVSVLVGTNVMAMLAFEESPTGIYAKICGTGGLIFISFGDNETPDPSKPNMTACHAICANEDLDEEDES